MGFCSRCGSGLVAPARFCANCGAPVHGQPAPVRRAEDLQDVTEEVPAVNPSFVPPPDDLPATSPVPAVEPSATWSTLVAIGVAARQRLRHEVDDTMRRLRPKAERWWAQQRRHSARTSVTVCGLLLVVAITIAWAAGGGGGPSPATSPTASRHPATSPRAARHARSNLSFGALNRTPSPTVQTYLAQVEGILQRSAAGRSQLAVAVRSVQPACGTPSPAALQFTTVLVTRGLLLQQLAALGPGPDPTTQAAASLLRQALEASTQADTQYRNWAAALATTASDQCASDPSVAASLAAAHAADGTASALKSQFVNLFNPLAAQFGLPTWSASDF